MALRLDTYLRTDLVSFKNVVDLDSQNKDGQTTYLGIDYSFAINGEFKNSPNKFYLKFERNGPYDYSAPLFIQNTLINSGGRVEKYRNAELLPQVEEFWLDNKLGGNFGLKTGLYIYEVGNGFSLNGGYENYGVTFYHQAQNIFWRLYYCRPDLVYKNILGPHIQQEAEQGQKYEPNAANFFATDIKITAGKQVFWPYIGMLADYTSSGKRDNLFAAPIKKDLLGTFGAAWEYAADDFGLKLEAARNFGYAQSQDSEYKDIRHTGYMFYSGLNYVLGKFVPELQFLFCSGNKETLDMAANPEELYISGKNRAFSYSSPTNRNLSDTVSSSNVDMLPIVAMGGGYGLNYGVPRPGTFYSGDFENLIMPSAGFDYNFTEKLCVSLYGYYLRAFSRPVGTLGGEGKYLSRDLGMEADLFIDYKATQQLSVGFLGGYFIPGRYYREKRDVDATLFSPYLRGDGNANNAYQLEFYVELKF
ncbi:MAG: hypothetical protein KKC39_07635 [Candidatus Omnitrophica bacterium]|nr:hypothetical protein [Candidatus Omnitrophota bacterium]MBU4468587.1 hypothetical protein [Candidatus Omnitrophota bacterium]MCG2708658.1 hypothetical protein [Candidatus Omnitrophota bacterium]